MDARWMCSVLMLGTLVFAAAACSDDDPVDPPEAPEPSASALLSLLDQQQYQQNWELWPVGELYEVCCGHEGDPAMVDLLTVYLNDLAMTAWENQAVMPEGATIVKEGYMTAEDDEGEPTLAVLTVMHKAAEGYDPDANDWFWLMYDVPGGEVAAEGRVAMCIGCHQSWPNHDLVIGPQVSP